MKILLYILPLLLLSFPAFSIEKNSPEELYYQTEKNKTETVNIAVLNGMKVNIQCFQNKKSCLDYLSTPYKVSLKEEKLSGNPVSVFCLNKKGDSIILRDKKFNEYDFCKFPGGLMVDSWDFFGKYK